jgi:uncharacterized sulfatase
MPRSRQIVLIMTDTQGTNVAGCYGRPEMRTPNIDRLAAEGVRADRAYTTCPVCGPARAGLFTGNYPHTNGCWGNNLPLGLNIKTVGQRFHDAGIRAAYTGKWHLDATDYFGNTHCPDGWDPDYWYDMRCYLEELTPEERLLSRQIDSPDKAREHNVTEDFCYAHRVSNRALDFLSDHGDEEFLLCVSYDEPHGPSMCPPRFAEMFEDFEYPLGANADDPLENKPEHQREWAESAALPRGRKTLKRAMYFACNSYVDYEIGRVIDAIDQHAPDALVVYTSDHGTPLLSHGLNSKGAAMYDETTRIPFIVRWPGVVPAGSVMDAPVSHIDVVPTFLDAAGLDTPDFLEGKSMAGALQQPDAAPVEPVFIEFNRYELDHDSMGGFQPIRCAFDGRHKLVINLHYTDELYDIKSDPDEMINLIDSPEHAALRDRLHDAILDWMGETRDPFRGAIWERRPWRTERRLAWMGMVRLRPDDGYEPRVLAYETGLEPEPDEFTYPNPGYVAWLERQKGKHNTHTQ